MSNAKQSSPPCSEKEPQKNLSAALVSADQSVCIARDLMKDTLILAMGKKIDVYEKLLIRVVDFLRTTSANSNWSSAVMSSHIIDSARGILKAALEALDIRDCSQKSAPGEKSGDQEQPSEAAAPDQQNTCAETPPSEESASEEKKPRKAHHPGKRREPMVPDEIVDIRRDSCPECGSADIQWTKSVDYQVLELLFKKYVKQGTVWSGVCNHCGHKVKSEVPPEYQSGYGPDAQAFIAALTGNNVSRRHVQDIISQTFDGVSISQGAIQNCLDRVSAAITPHVEAIETVIRKSPVCHVDETSSRLFGPPGKEKHWLWVMTNPQMTLYKIYPTRSAESFKNLVGDWKGILVADGYALYLKWEGLARQFCLAHPIRKAKKCTQSSAAKTAEGGAWLLDELRRLAAMAHTAPTRGQFMAWKARFSKCLKYCKSIEGDLATFATTLEKELKADSLFTFLKYDGVASTNNRAEQQIRPMVCRRKTSFGSTSLHGEEDIAKLMTLCETCRQNGRSFFGEISDAIRHMQNGTEPDLSWIHEMASK